MKVTIKDIAREANVSIGTVSRVINNKAEGVGEETRKRVIAIINELEYKPNALARGLITNKTKIIGLIIPDISNPFFPVIARGVEDQANTLGYSIFLCNTDDDYEKESRYINVLKEHCVDGIIFTSNASSNHQQAIDLKNIGIPVVIIDRMLDDSSINGIFSDNIHGGFLATKHLLDLNHKKIGCITGPLSSRSAIDRHVGYKKALKEAGIDYIPDYVVEGDYKIDGGYNAAMCLLSREVRAIFVSNDLMAYGVYRAAKEKNLRIPEDLSIVGFDDVLQSQLLVPSLTTIAQPTYEMGKAATKMLIKIIEGKRLNKKAVEYAPKLVVRESTAKLI